LRASQHKLSRRIQWHPGIAVPVAGGVLSRSSLALAKADLFKIGAGCHDDFVILDVSRSMRLQQPGGDTPFVACEEIARALLDQGLPGDRATVLLTGSNSVALGPLAEDPTRYVARLEGGAVLA